MMPGLNTAERRQVAFKLCTSVTGSCSAEAAAANLIAGRLLGQLIEHKLRAKGLITGRCTLAGELGLFLGWVEVSDVGATIDLLKAEISALGLLDCCRIAWFCESELIWRLASPDELKGRAVAEFITRETLKYVREECATMVALAKSQMKEISARHR